jgi:hypothetical protein
MQADRLGDLDAESQRLLDTADGFAWNGTTYPSLSRIACVITGTRWNGPKFFGLRDTLAKGRAQ